MYNISAVAIRKKKNPPTLILLLRQLVTQSIPVICFLCPQPSLPDLVLMGSYWGALVKASLPLVTPSGNVLLILGFLNLLSHLISASRKVSVYEKPTNPCSASRRNCSVYCRLTERPAPAGRGRALASEFGGLSPNPSFTSSQLCGHFSVGHSFPFFIKLVQKTRPESFTEWLCDQVKKHILTGFGKQHPKASHSYDCGYSDRPVELGRLLALWFRLLWVRVKASAIASLPLHVVP